MSIEKQARAARRRVVFWRIVGAAIDIPARFFNVCACLFNIGTDFCRDVGKAVFYLELDAARRYQLLTGIDLALAAGDDGRYEMLDPKAQEREREAVEDDDDD